MATNTLIVGGGIVGLSAAYFLARRGAAVTLLDTGDLEGGASSGNAGLVAAGHGPLPRPGLSLRSLRWVLDQSGPLYLPPRFDPGLVRWLFGFHRACGRSRYDRAIELLTAHGHPARVCFRTLVDEERIDCEYRPIGQLDVFRTDAGMREGEREAALLRRHGYDSEILNGAELRRREPAFRPGVRGAVLYTDRAFANPAAFMRALAERVRRHGGLIRPHSPVARLDTQAGRCVGVTLETGETLRADCTTLAAGVWTTALARTAGVRIPMQAAKGYHAAVTAPATSVRTACVLAERFVAVNPIDGGLRLAGTLEFSGINHRFVPKRVTMLRHGAAEYLEGIETTTEQSVWCGLRPCTADGLPVIGWAPRVRDLFVATGHAMMGFGLGPLAGRLTAESILDGTPSVALEGFGADRF
ncbi:MAG: FAD-dependent oxidoreductase [Phycisphaerales bacterium]|nr:FAD-dependent oxidoreductase [Phycisphaerae bacterium]NNF42227.1 FAD-dependent oxidoreductase [Phycisphaerales bacterium]NNM27309.1 FAD-dependent oxidoreductase [Phycisphaerales bacterium]